MAIDGGKDLVVIFVFIKNVFMNSFFKMFFASLLAIVVSTALIFLFIFLIIAGLSRSVTEKDKKSGNVLVLDVSDKLHEQGESNSIAGLSKNAAQYTGGVYDVVKAIDRARTDNNVKGIFLKLDNNVNGWATLQQLHQALERFKGAGKFIYGYGENISQSGYYLGTAADSIYVNPMGNIDLKGFASVMPFFKGALDRLEIQPEIFYAGKFKSATEPLRAEKMSDPNRQQIAALHKSIWSELLGAASKHTGVSADELNQMAQKGLIQFPLDALKYKLINGLAYLDQVEQTIRAKTNQKENEEIKYLPLNDYISNNRIDGNTNDQKIAILYAEGNIVDGEESSDYEIASKTMADNIRKIRNNDKIKAVVLRINSPGGSALASEVILRELDLLREKKPLIVSMGDVAASGGYYIASHADSIFALPNTITGSIGVFGMMFNIDKFMKDKLGVTFDEEKNAPYADLPTMTRPLTPEEGQRMQNAIDTIYEVFKKRVSDGRRISPADVDSIAQGRVWSGTDAVGIKLVDGLGGIDRAIASAAAMGKVKDYKIITYPEPVDKLESLLRKMKMNTSTSEAIRSALKEHTGKGSEWIDEFLNLRKMNGKAMMAMPFVPVIE
jgi:protease IV